MAAFPKAIEKDYARSITRRVRAVERLLLLAFDEWMTPLRTAELAERAEHRTDAIGDPETFTRRVKHAYEKTYTDELAKEEAAEIAKRASGDVDKKLTRAYKKATGVKPLIGADNKDIAAEFARHNADLITTLGDDLINDVRERTQQMVREGRRRDEIVSMIHERGDVSVSWAKFIARDQLAKLVSNLNEERQTNLGVSRYIWRTVGDESVRQTHVDNNGETFSWNDPPAETGHPGEDYQCLPGDSQIDASLGIQVLYRRWFDGELVRIETASGRVIRATENHPILTDSGWMPIGQIDAGRRVIRCNIKPAFVMSIGELFNAHAAHREVAAVIGTPGQFHEDGTGEPTDVIRLNVNHPMVEHDAAALSDGHYGPLVTGDSRVVSATREAFSGFVYNLQTSAGWYISQGFAVRNCRCTAEPIIADVLADLGLVDPQPSVEKPEPAKKPETAEQKEEREFQEYLKTQEKRKQKWQKDAEPTVDYVKAKHGVDITNLKSGSDEELVAIAKLRTAAYAGGKEEHDALTYLAEKSIRPDHYESELFDIISSKQSAIRKEVEGGKDLYSAMVKIQGDLSDPSKKAPFEYSSFGKSTRYEKMPRNASKASKAKASKIADQFASLLPEKYLGNKSWDGTKFEMAFVNTGKRAHFINGGKGKPDIINIGTFKEGALESRRVVFHELGHWLETRPGVLTAEKQFLSRRLRGKSSEYVSGKETGIDGGFVSKYVGKVYISDEKSGLRLLRRHEQVDSLKLMESMDAGEVVSVGMEKFSSPHSMQALYERDPEHFAFIHSILSGEI